MKHTKKIFNILIIFLLPFLLGNTVGKCKFLDAIFEITLPPPPEKIDYNGIAPYHSVGFILAADYGKIYYVNHPEEPDSYITIQGTPDLFDAKLGHLNNHINIVVGANGTILRSSQAQPEWALIPSPVSHNLNKITSCSIFGQGEEVFLIAGDNGTILKSTDLGLTWEICPFPNTENLHDVFSAFCDKIDVTGDNYTAFRSTDGGKTWFPIGPGEMKKSSGPQLSYKRIYYYNDTLGFIGGPNGLVLKTTDGGVSWEVKVAQGIDQINDIYFISPDSGAAVGTNGQARFTTDGGETWLEDPVVTNFLNGREVKRIFALSRNHGFIVGEGNLLTFAATDSTYLDSTFVTSVEDNISPVKEFVLYQNYPNPFNPSTTIHFSIPEQSFVKLEVFNALGEKISTLVSEELSAGNYKYEWNASATGGLPSGIYFYKIQTASFTEIKKMVLLK